MSKTLTRIIGEGTAWLSVASVVVKVIGLATTLIVLSTLSLRGYGTVELVMSVTSFLGILMLPSLQQIVIADMGIERGKGRGEAARSLLRQYFVLQFTCGVLAWAIIFFGADIIATYLNAYVAGMLKILSFWFLVAPIRSTLGTLFRVNYQFITISALQISEAIFKLSFTATVLLYLGMNAEGVIWAFVVTEFFFVTAAMPSALFGYRTLRANAQGEGRVSLVRNMLDHGKWAVAAGYTGQLGKGVKLWIVKFFLGTEAVAIFAVAEGMLMQVRNILPLQKILASIIPQHDPQSRTFEKLLMKGIKYNTAGVMLLGFAGAIGVPILIYTLVPQYATSVIVFELMLFSMVPAAVSGVLSLVFFAMRKQRDLFFSNLARQVIGIVVLIPTLPILGIYATALMIFVEMLFYAIERYRRAKRVLPHLELRLRDLIAFDELDRKLLARIAKRLPLMKRARS